MKRLTVFVHYNKKNIIADYVLYYINCLDKISEELVFVSNSKIDSCYIDKLKKFTSKIIIRENQGYDFMAWRDGLRYIGYDNLSQYDELIIANDSNFGPLFPLEELFTRSLKVDCDFWGLTESCSFNQHLQSSFLVFKNNILISEVFKSFWENIKIEKSKIEIIKKYELGLQEKLENSGFKSHALFKVKVSKFQIMKYKFNRIVILLKKKLKNDLGYYEKKPNFIKGNPKGLLFNFFNLKTFNVTICCWEELIKMRCPFLKVEVVRDNSYGLKNVKYYDEIFKKKTDYNVELIKSHLRQLDL